MKTVFQNHWINFNTNALVFHWFVEKDGLRKLMVFYGFVNGPQYCLGRIDDDGGIEEGQRIIKKWELKGDKVFCLKKKQLLFGDLSESPRFSKQKKSKKKHKETISIEKIETLLLNGKTVSDRLLLPEYSTKQPVKYRLFGNKVYKKVHTERSSCACWYEQKMTMHDLSSHIKGTWGGEPYHQRGNRWEFY